jgi:hypothetical protein
MVVPVEAMLIIGSLRGSVEALGNIFIYIFEYFIVFLENTTYMGSRNYAFFYVTQFFLRNYSILHHILKCHGKAMAHAFNSRLSKLELILHQLLLCMSSSVSISQNTASICATVRKIVLNASSFMYGHTKNFFGSVIFIQ